MSEPTTLTRRGLLRAAGAAAVAATVPTTVSANEEWMTVETPTGNALHDVEYAVDGAYAVGGGGIVLRRMSEGWSTVLKSGPTGNGNNLYGSDVTDGGEVLWFVGSSGAIGAYDVSTGDLTDYSAPNDVTNNFNDVAVTGDPGAADVYVAGDSGKIYYSFDNGETWDSVTPGSGSNVNAIDFHGDGSGHAVDGNKTAFETDDGSTYGKIGIADANVNLYGVDSDTDDEVWVACGGGIIYRWDGAEWVPTDTGDASLRDIEVASDAGLTVGGGGTVYGYDGSVWTRQSTPTGQNLKAVVRGPTDVAVGASGTVIER